MPGYFRVFQGSGEMRTAASNFIKKNPNKQTKSHVLRMFDSSTY